MKEQLQIDIDLTKDRLRGQAESLKRSMELLLLRLEKNNLQQINRMGEVQGLGSAVDVSCMELKTLLYLLDMTSE
ncbi:MULTISPECIES: hypothetical protein [Bacillus]|uniref:hypothetical protein n=1 Tax=Bacillus TaxID=1386 RepID=UPI000C7715DA|nr:MULTISPECIES: hypothetical protein [Bacillus]PLR72263.1 hypothetical protein CYJ37_11955 [Bacillus sp. UMB0728]RYI30552.1 hypothetical protein EVU96_09050 [Bacillus infantis]